MFIPPNGTTETLSEAPKVTEKITHRNENASSELPINKNPAAYFDKNVIIPSSEVATETNSEFGAIFLPPEKTIKPNLPASGSEVLNNLLPKSSYPPVPSIAEIQKTLTPEKQIPAEQQFNTDYSAPENLIQELHSSMLKMLNSNFPVAPIVKPTSLPPQQPTYISEFLSTNNFNPTQALSPASFNMLVSEAPILGLFDNDRQAILRQIAPTYHRSETDSHTESLQQPELKELNDELTQFLPSLPSFLALPAKSPLNPTTVYNQGLLSGNKLRPYIPSLIPQ